MLLSATHGPGLPDPDLRPEFYDAVPMKRALAWVVDVVLISLLSVLLTPLTLFTSILYFPVFYVLVGFCYRTAAIARLSGTPGMRLMSLELRDASGRRFDLGHAALHTAGYTASWMVFPAQLVSGALMVGTSRAQGLTDLVMGSAAINRTGES